MVDFNSLTDEEKKAVRALKRVAKIWPKSLWLWSGSGSLWVMKNDSNDGYIERPTKDGRVNEECIIDSIDIPNDGGDW